MYYSKAYSQYGASMGRPNFRDHENTEKLKFRLARVPLNNGGYDPGGAYWGTPSNLYVAECETEDAHSCYTTRFFLRASDRTAAKAEVLRQYPNARFYR